MLIDSMFHAGYVSGVFSGVVYLSEYNEKVSVNT